MAATILAARSSLDGRRAGLVRRTVAEVAAGVQVLLGAAVVLIAAGSISAAPAHQQRVSLDFLAPGRTYALHLVRDNGSGRADRGGPHGHERRLARRGRRVPRRLHGRADASGLKPANAQRASGQARFVEANPGSLPARLEADFRQPLTVLRASPPATCMKRRVSHAAV